MGKLVSTLFVTLDGVYQAPGGPKEDTRGGFTHGGWSFWYADEDFGRFVNDVFARPDAFLLGRRTYDIFSSYWPKVTDPADPVASKLNSLPKYVPSSTLKDPEWAGTTVLSGDLAKEVTALKERIDGEVQVHGSGALVRSLLSLDLVDTLHLLTFPVVLGAGFRLFPEGAVPTAFRHTGGSVSGAGVSMQTYDLAGRPEYGEYKLPEDA
ncbi:MULTISPECIES: dihydrofolate reductase family protein [Streptomyces]|jgi:dihydrofolate reductase|uniref:Dihydrofolate reductase family protein n=1 Tax=Streptomyces violaceus TaxID=1936 RepID=A0ABY9U391_STRVL|nr:MULTISPECIES: dihydrofolate reductase family protein [Streptomyces]WND17264.1 dihydrofolate reductase family protein [Streptomyces janthinus]WNF66002.1 dihydrofolate reductase family protein [Streptomyces sp. CGMCC 4.1456]GGS39345.1 deaminase reductase [Streptomyces janthinus]